MKELERNILEIRKINIDIIDNIVNILEHPVELTAKNNIYSYSEQLSYYLDNYDKVYNYMNDNTDIESTKQSTSSLIDFKIKLWMSQNQPNTIEFKLNEIYTDFLIDYNYVKMCKTIELLIS
jgi:hypothetical protein